MKEVGLDLNADENMQKCCEEAEAATAAATHEMVRESANGINGCWVSHPWDK